MPWIADAVLDAALQKIEDDIEVLYICSTAEPTTFAEASNTYMLGYKLTPTMTGPGEGDASGRKTTIDAIAAGGLVVAAGTAAYWAVTDDSESALLLTGALASSQVVTSGNTFTLTAIDIEITDPT